jgi:hypothetical protein
MEVEAQSDDWTGYWGALGEVGRDTQNSRVSAKSSIATSLFRTRLFPRGHVIYTTKSFGHYINLGRICFNITLLLLLSRA